MTTCIWDNEDGGPRTCIVCHKQFCNGDGEPVLVKGIVAKFCSAAQDSPTARFNYQIPKYVREPLCEEIAATIINKAKKMLYRYKEVSPDKLPDISVIDNRLSACGACKQLEIGGCADILEVGCCDAKWNAFLHKLIDGDCCEFK